MDEIRMRRAIERKRDGASLDPLEWEEMIGAYLAGRIDDAQMAAMAMACVWRGMNAEESVALTRAMVASGETLKYQGNVPVVDKHSSGGVGDIVSLVAVPLVAACGVRVAKLSGRALGHTGGTIDKLEAIPGFRASISMDAFVAQVERIGCAIAAQSSAIVPADKKLYALRDRTATVPCIGLIAASIVSKKIAAGAEAFAFDVKCGSAAFMRDPDTAIELAGALVEIARAFGRKACAVVSDMNEPLSRSIGTALEVIEAREILRGGEMDARIREGCLQIVDAMLVLAGVASPRECALDALASGAGYEKFVQLIEAQGSSRHALERMRAHDRVAAIVSPRSGFVSAIDAQTLGNVVREWTDEESNAGLNLRVRIGDPIQRGAPLAIAYGSDVEIGRIVGAFTIAEVPPEVRPLRYATL